MWFIGQGGNPRKNTELTADDNKLLQSIISRVSAIKEALKLLDNDSIVFTISDQIEEWRLSSTMAHLDKEDESYRAAISRGFIHAYKLAAIFAMADPAFQKGVFSLPPSNYPIRVQIPAKHAMSAIRVVENYLMPRTMFVYGLCSQADEKNHQVMILKALDHYGGVADRTKILRKTHLGSKEVTVAIKTLVESGEVKVCERKREGADRPVTFILKTSS